ncbi:unnamed protein product [Arabidopsis halleri]
MKIIPLMLIALVTLLTLFPGPIEAVRLGSCENELQICRGLIKKRLTPDEYRKHSICCDNLLKPKACMCLFMKYPKLTEPALYFMRSCGQGIGPDPFSDFC